MNYKVRKSALDQKNRFSLRAFTMLELIFVIVVMGILSKFGVEFFAQSYNSFIFSSVNNSLQARSATAVESIAARLQFRIKDSIIARKLNGDFDALGSADAATADDYRILEWIASDIEGFRGDSLPYYSGIIDLQPSSTDILISPETNTTALDNQIAILSHGSGTGINNAAIYFIGSNSNINRYGWIGTGSTSPLVEHNTSTMHPIQSTGNINEFASSIIAAPDFNGTDVYEYYQLAWTAYAVVHATDGNLTLHYDYQPWEGESYTDGKEALLMQDVSTFRFKAVGSVVKIQVCVNSDLLEDYSLCKEKTIY